MPRALIRALAHREEGRGAGQRRARRARRRERPRDRAPPPTRCIAGKLDDQFPLVVWQTGSGTQTNMNVNEVHREPRDRDGSAASAAKKRGPSERPRQPRRSRRTTSSRPRCTSRRPRRCAATLLPRARRAARRAGRRSRARSRTSSRSAARTCRTRRRSRSGRSSRARSRSSTTAPPHLEAALPHLCELALGGTAVGTGLNAHPEYAARVRDRARGADRPAVRHRAEQVRGARRPRRARRSPTARSRRSRRR